MQRRKKVGGITDRRFGENDPTMTLEEKALERFVREKQRGVKKESQFDLDDEEEDVQLTHFGESLSFDRADKTDDFNEPDLGVSDEDGHDVAEEHGSRKRRKLSGLGYSDENSTDEDSEMGSERPKTKQEVMKEVMAKSKLHKYERQQAKEDDDDLRAELDKGLPDLFALIRGSQPQAPSQRPQAGAGLDHGMNPDRAALLDGKDRSQADKEYDERLRQMQFDQRSKPTNPTKTEEERLSEEAQRLKELEEKRLRRMRGDEDSSDEEFDHIGQEAQGDDDIELDEAEILGIGSGISGEVEKQQLDVEDEDDFVIENDLVASDIDTSDGEHNSLPVSNDGSSEDEDLEFIHGLPSADSFRKDDTRHTKPQIESNNEDGDSNDLAYTYSCPQSHQDFRLITETIPIEKTTIVVQRIRALYHPKLHGDNKAKLEIFSAVLVDHISFLANQTTHPPFAVLEALIRHIHSLAKTFPEAVGRAFRSHLKSLHETRPNSPTPGDLIILTAIASIFPTSDHFHQVVTPAILCMARYMGQKIPHSLGDFAVGTYLETLCLHYQRLSKRYVPELVNYSLNVLYTLAPAKPTQILSCFPCYMQTSLSLVDATPERPEPLERKLSFWDIGHPKDSPEKANKELKISLLNTHIAFFDAMADLWASKSAFYEVFNPVSNVLRHLTSNACLSRLNTTTKVRTSCPPLNYSIQLIRSFTEQREENTSQSTSPSAASTSLSSAIEIPHPSSASYKNLNTKIRRVLQSRQALRSGQRSRRHEQT